MLAHAVVAGLLVTGLAYVTIKKHLTLAAVKAEVVKLEASATTDAKLVIADIKAKLGL